MNNHKNVWKYITPGIIIFTVLNVLDVVTTMCAIRIYNMAEVNPFMNFVIEHVGFSGVIALKIGLVVYIYFTCRGMLKRNENRWYLVTVWIMNSIYSAVIINNFYQLWRAYEYIQV